MFHLQSTPHTLEAGGKTQAPVRGQGVICAVPAATTRRGWNVTLGFLTSECTKVVGSLCQATLKGK